MKRVNEISFTKTEAKVLKQFKTLYEEEELNDTELYDLFVAIVGCINAPQEEHWFERYKTAERITVAIKEED